MLRSTVAVKRGTGRGLTRVRVSTRQLTIASPKAGDARSAYRDDPLGVLTRCLDPVTARSAPGQVRGGCGFEREASDALPSHTVALRSWAECCAVMPCIRSALDLSYQNRLTLTWSPTACRPAPQVSECARSWKRSRCSRIQGKRRPWSAGASSFACRPGLHPCQAYGSVPGRRRRR
mgnify:CR=1 FL=1